MNTTTKVNHIILDQKLVLSHLRGMYWEQEKTLIFADSHLGKSGHFQKAGIPVPGEVLHSDLLRLTDLIREFEPQRLLILGDFFHSTYNEDWDTFQAWREQYPTIKIQLVKGNHDILPQELYERLDIQLIPEYLEEGPFFFTHKPAVGEVPDKRYVVCGHVHPGIELRGKAKQSVRLPCFYIGASHIILPAFSEFTGMASINPKQIDAIYAVTDKGIHTFR